MNGLNRQLITIIIVESCKQRTASLSLYLSILPEKPEEKGHSDEYEDWVDSPDDDLLEEDEGVAPLDDDDDYDYDDDGDDDADDDYYED
ncbi:hypothetical protein KL921_000962 [Ogataea angusta]|uniref:Uncharacterized protein n=1 Tax=Pichia angusta TaxID=870730 RepID=A0AAN6DHL7_PICAN|nr:uncharacterized protein KL928_001130 [Ogataea angusta]KAG7813416.1 hypothetical protein KL921_000962 [Ogataea angusta]KAG7821046.1 hypothetical protein KL928_001130 [Ogataea angusta]KAG7826253.1 hypothetical protein KL909_000305 [Ogataea angusta]KAG7832000.1 hypothetical protein KL920_000335 [Ogataea angusta]KAG7836172.1 hypothetical protein KL943_001821 [Ogataea angusta]